MSARPVREVGSRLRIDCCDVKRTQYVELDLDGRKTLLTRGAARALTSAVLDRLATADEFDIQEAAVHGVPELTVFSSMLHMEFEVIHDGEVRDELLAVVFARIESVLRKEVSTPTAGRAGSNRRPATPSSYRRRSTSRPASRS